MGGASSPPDGTSRTFGAVAHRYGRTTVRAITHFCPPCLASLKGALPTELLPRLTPRIHAAQAGGALRWQHRCSRHPQGVRRVGLARLSRRTPSGSTRARVSQPLRTGWRRGPAECTLSYVAAVVAIWFDVKVLEDGTDARPLGQDGLGLSVPGFMLRETTRL